jgi:hypothetical protein
MVPFFFLGGFFFPFIFSTLLTPTSFSPQKFGPGAMVFPLSTGLRLKLRRARPSTEFPFNTFI